MYHKVRLYYPALVPHHMVRTTHCGYLAFALHNQATTKSTSIAPFTALCTTHQHRQVRTARSIQSMTSTPCCHPTPASNSALLSALPQQQIQETLANETTNQNSAKQPDYKPLLPASILTSVATTNATDAMTRSVPKSTFYRRSLPDTCVAFSSKLGRKYFESAMRHGGLKSYFHLMEQYTTQSEPAFCGISTLVIALNALAVDPRQIWKGSWRWYEESMLNCCIDFEQAKETGITMAMFNCLALCQGLSTDLHYVDECTADLNSAENTNSSSLDNFREMVKEACVETDDWNDDHDKSSSHHDMSVDRVLVASYSRKALRQTGSGHFSPIAAYDQESDSVLIMDTARFKYGAHWVKLPLLYEAMQAIDPDTGRSRGYMMLIHQKDDDATHSTQHPPTQPIPILLRSDIKQSDVRRKFKNFLVNLGGKPSYEDIANFFYSDGSYLSIWGMVLPQLRPYDNDIATTTIVDEVRSLADLVLSDVRKSNVDKGEQIDDSNQCRANHCRTIKLRTEEAIVIVYLACLDVKEREALIFHPKFKSSTTEQARFQLLNEAELVRNAIDTSDQVLA